MSLVDTSLHATKCSVYILCYWYIWICRQVDVVECESIVFGIGVQGVVGGVWCEKYVLVVGIGGVVGCC